MSVHLHGPAFMKEPRIPLAMQKGKRWVCEEEWKVSGAERRGKSCEVSVNQRLRAEPMSDVIGFRSL